MSETTSLLPAPGFRGMTSTNPALHIGRAYMESDPHQWVRELIVNSIGGGCDSLSHPIVILKGALGEQMTHRVRERLMAEPIKVPVKFMDSADNPHDTKLGAVATTVALPGRWA